MTEYVLGFAIWRSKILFMKKNRGPENLIGKLNGVGGKIEENESEFSAMVREFKEETGLETLKIQWTNFGLIEFLGGGRAHLFRIELNQDIDYSDLKNPEEDEPLQWSRLEYVEDDVVPNLRWILPLMFDSTTPFVHIKEK